MNVYMFQVEFLPSRTCADIQQQRFTIAHEMHCVRHFVWQANKRAFSRNPRNKKDLSIKQSFE